MQRILLFIAICLAHSQVKSQNFDYTVSTDSVAWNELNAQTILNANNSAWSFSYKIPIGFTFNYLGRNFDSLTVETNGYVVFDQHRSYALTAFSGVGDVVDTSGNHSVLGYELSGSPGSHVLKIQYRNCGYGGSATEIQSWQIWLKENGNVEFHIGTGTLRSNVISVTVFNESTQLDSTYNLAALDTTQKCRIGLLNMNMDTPDRGLFIGEDPVMPQSQPVNDIYPEIIYLNLIPPAGYRYTFTPSAN